MINLLSKLPLYKLSRMTGMIPPLPINYTLGLTYKCQARCKTCNIHQRDNGYELTVAEWVKIFEGMGRSPYWITFTGGEPFLYKDITEVFYHLTRICKPAIVNIPTNGQLTERITEQVWDMAKMSPETQIIINLSLDHHDPDVNDYIRGVDGYHEKALRTLSRLKEQANFTPNVQLGIHTVVSIHNVDAIPIISDRLSSLLPCHENYITEIAEERAELGTIRSGITPDKKRYQAAIKPLLARKKGVKQAFRRRYYQNVCKVIVYEPTVTCYAGYSSCQITPDGDVWACCIKSECMGNLRHQSFREIWQSDRARTVRSHTKDCYCPMANVSYTNMMLDFKTALSIGRELIL